ncbi:MAG: 4-alpha-glucanotransferase, partial [Betaproteobacteria bacterium RBG_16_66_20]
LHEIGREDIDGILYAEFELEFGAALPSGYHRLQLLAAQRALGETLVVAAPERCFRPGPLADGARLWGPAVQLYALRSERNWGIGDFSDLARLVEDWAALGAGVVGLNPLHALFAHDPAHASPYSPSSRERLNPLYLDVEAIDDFRGCEEAQRLVRAAGFQARLARLREAPMVDYPGVAAAKSEILGRIYVHFREHHLAAASARGRAFREFQARAGVALRRHALFEALQAHFHAADASISGWHRWPREYRDPDMEAVAHFAAEKVERVEYFEYLQWEAERQLAEIGARCAARGLALGLYLDLAVSVHRAGSDAWSNLQGYALGASIGAPPDDFNPNGQNWGLPPPRPDRLRTGHCEIFRRALAQNMRHAGALRIDHVMGLMRLFWIPPGATAGDGAYVHYAFDELLAIVVLESHRNRCMVIGEDLGTVPDAVREGLARVGALCCRLLYFERDAQGGFKPGADYPREALIAVGTHDLATLAGWWEGRDLRLRRQFGMIAQDGIYETRLAERAQERVRLMLALEHAGLLPEGTVPDPSGAQALTPALVEAVHVFLAAAPSRVMMVQIEDTIGVSEQANMPGTTLEYPNWRRKLPETLERLAASARVGALAARLAALRRPPSRDRDG